MASLLDLETQNNDLFTRLKRAEETIAELQRIVGTKLFQIIPGDEGFLGNRAYSTAWVSLGWPPANVEKFHVYDGNLKVEGNGFEDVTGGTIYLQNKPSLKGASPADNDVAGLIRALAVNDAGNPIIIADMYFQCTDVTEGSEDGAVRIVTQKDYADAFVFNLVRDRVGINELDPQRALHVVGGDGAVGSFPSNVATRSEFLLENNNNAFLGIVSDVDSLAGLRCYEDGQTGVQGFIHYDHSADQWLFAVGANGTARVTIGTGLQVGAPTGGNKGAGTINAAGDIYKNNSAFTNPDYALELWATGVIEAHKDKPGAAAYVRRSLAEVEAHILEHHKLPGFSDAPMGAFERGDLLLEKVEELYTHVIEQKKEIEALKARVAELEAGRYDD